MIPNPEGHFFRRFTRSRLRCISGVVIAAFFCLQLFWAYPEFINIASTKKGPQQASTLHLAPHTHLRYSIGQGKGQPPETSPSSETPDLESEEAGAFQPKVDSDEAPPPSRSLRILYQWGVFITGMIGATVILSGWLPLPLMIVGVISAGVVGGAVSGLYGLKSIKKLSRLTLFFVTASLLFSLYSGGLLYLRHQVQQNLLFSPFFVQNSQSTSTPAVNGDANDEVKLDRETEILLQEKLAVSEDVKKLCGNREFRQFLHQFNPQSRQILIEVIAQKVEKVKKDIMDSSLALDEMVFTDTWLPDFVLHMEMGDQKNGITSSGLQELWKLLTGESYELKKLMENYYDRSGPFKDLEGLTRDEQNGKEHLGNIFYLISNVAEAKVPHEFKVDYLKMVREESHLTNEFKNADLTIMTSGRRSISKALLLIYSGTIDSYGNSASALEGACRIVTSLDKNFFQDTAHYYKALQFLPAFYLKNRDVILTMGATQEIVEQKILSSEGGIENVLKRLAQEPTLGYQLVEHKETLVTFITNFGNKFFRYSGEWRLDQIIQFANGINTFVEKVEKKYVRSKDGVVEEKVKIEVDMPGLGNRFAELYGMGIPITPDLPEKLSDASPEVLRALLADWFLTSEKREGKIAPRDIRAFKKLAEVWALFAIFGHGKVIQNEVDLSELPSIVRQGVLTQKIIVQGIVKGEKLELGHDEAEVLEEIFNRAEKVSTLFIREVQKVLKPSYYDPISVKPRMWDTFENIRKGMQEIRILEVFEKDSFHIFDKTKRDAVTAMRLRGGIGDKTPRYLNQVTLPSIAQWERICQEFTLDDTPLAIRVLELVKKKDQLPYYDYVRTYVETMNPVGKDFKNIARIEEIRSSLNHLDPVIGDSIVLISARQFIEKNPPTLKNIHFLLGVVEKWAHPEKSVPNPDVQQLYHLVANFIGNSIIQYLSQDLSELPKYREELSRLKGMGFEIPKNTSLVQKGISNLHKFLANAIVGNWRYLVGKSKNIEGNQKTSQQVILSRNPEWKLPAGYEVTNVVTQGKTVAYLVRGDPKQQARVQIDFDVGYSKGGVSAETFQKDHPDKVNVFDFPVAFTTGEGKPTDLCVQMGSVQNWLMSLQRNHGLLIAKTDGTVHIADKKNLWLSDLYQDKSKMPREDRKLNLGKIEDYWLFLEIANEQVLSITTNMLLINKQTGYVATTKDHLDSRRLLLEFEEGSFGVLNMNIPASTSDAVQMATSIPGVVRAMYCDTGFYDFATLHTTNKGNVVLGHSDNPSSSNRVFFYVEPVAGPVSAPKEFPKLNLLPDQENQREIEPAVVVKVRNPNNGEVKWSLDGVPIYDGRLYLTIPEIKLGESKVIENTDYSLGTLKEEAIVLAAEIVKERVEKSEPVLNSAL